jgi:hypothetical protein
MPTNYTRLGELMSRDPMLAHSRLTALFSRHRVNATVAEKAGVNESTLRRWVARLLALGFKDPRVVRHGERGPDKRPRAPKTRASVSRSVK